MVTTNTIAFTPVSAIPKIVAESRASFLTHRTQSLEFRKEQLRALQALVNENADELTAAIQKDLNRPSDFEIPTCKAACKLFLENLDSLVENQKARGLHESDDCYVRLSPLGSVLIIGPWNFPIMLVVEPLAGAIAAGNTVVVKPSEVAAHSGALLSQLLVKYMDPRVVAVVNGGAEETTALLKERFDHIFYTGGTAVGKIVMQAAAKNLTPVTLELGGKCPAIVTHKTDLVKAGQKIAGWKAMNCGQVCLSVDYILCPRDLQQDLIKVIVGTWQHMFGEDSKQSD
ncbi:Aldehyde dehydrogenase, dimeric NADP-preferring, partial [Gryganskiella cystojenkinii]